MTVGAAHRARAAAAALGLSAALAPRPSAAADAKECTASHEQGLADYEAGKLRAAREKLKVCASESCPKLTRGECILALERITADMPTLVLSATDDSGADLIEVRVWIDGALAAERLSGRAVELEPGEHEVRFVNAEGAKRVVKVLIKQGEKNRRVSVLFTGRAPGKTAPVPAPTAEPAPAPAPAPADTSGPPPSAADRSGPPIAAYVLGGVGLVALGGFGYFGLTAKSEQSDLEDRCAPACTKGEYRSMKQKYLYADVALGVAVVSLGLSTYFFLSPRGQEPRAGMRVQLGPGAAHVDVAARF